MAALLTKVKARMTLHAHRRTRGLLDGEYASVFHGQSLDFDDLRQYVPGDEVRDIDWRATARHSSPLVRRYVAHRRHQLALVVDTGANTRAVSANGDNKRDVSILLAGMSGYLAVRGGDDVMLIHGNAEATGHSRAKGTEAHLEQLLRTIQSAPTDVRSGIGAQLSWLARTMRKRMLVIVIADDSEITPDLEALLRRLRVQHEIMWATIADADLSTLRRESPQDVTSPGAIPQFLMSGEDMWRDYHAREAERIARQAAAFKRLGIPATRIAGTKDCLHGLFTLMERQRRGSR